MQQAAIFFISNRSRCLVSSRKSLPEQRKSLGFHFYFRTNKCTHIRWRRWPEEGLCRSEEGPVDGKGFVGIGSASVDLRRASDGLWRAFFGLRVDPCRSEECPCRSEEVLCRSEENPCRSQGGVCLRERAPLIGGSVLHRRQLAFWISPARRCPINFSSVGSVLDSGSGDRRFES